MGVVGREEKSGCVDDVWMEVWMDGWMVGWMDGWLLDRLIVV